MAERETTEDFPLHRAERPVGSLLADLARQFSLLLRQEMALARAEILGKLGQLGGGAGMIVAGSLVAFSGLLYLLAAGVLALAKIVEPWLAAAIIGGGALLIGLVLVLIGRARVKAESLVPHRTVRSLKDDAEWAREQIR